MALGSLGLVFHEGFCTLYHIYISKGGASLPWCLWIGYMRDNAKKRRRNEQSRLALLDCCRWHGVPVALFYATGVVGQSGCRVVFPPSSASCHPSSCSSFLLFFASFAPLPSPRPRLGPPPPPLAPPPTPAPFPHPAPPVPHLAPPSRRFPLVVVVSPLLCIALLVSTLLLMYLATPPPLHLTTPARLAPPPPCHSALLHVVFLIVPLFGVVVVFLLPSLHCPRCLRGLACTGIASPSRQVIVAS